MFKTVSTDTAAGGQGLYIKSMKNEQRIRDNIRRFEKSKVEYCPPSNWSQSENFGKGACLNPRQIEKRRRRSLWS